MLRIEAIANDIKLKLEYDGTQYHLQINATEGKTTLTCSVEQASAIMALFVWDETPLSEKAYEVIGDLFKNTPNNLRPIP